QPAAPFNTPPAPGDHYVRIVVHYQNSSGSSQPAIPLAVQLQDPNGVQHGLAPLLSRECWPWSTVGLADGASAADESMCFEVGGNPQDHLVLLWQPHLSRVNIDLTGR